MFANVLAVLFAISCVFASPIPRDVPTSKCKAVRSGVLRTANGHHISLKGDSLVFGGKGLEVTFQSCQPNFGKYDGKDGRALGGHIYVPSIKKCLTVPSSASPEPIGLTVAACELTDDSRQTFQNFTDKDGNVNWVGGTQADGSFIQNHKTCSTGHYGVKNSLTSGSVALYCATEAHISAFKI